MVRALKNILNPITTTPLDAHKVHFVEEITIAAVEVPLAVKPLKAAGCDEIRPEMLRALNRGVLCLTLVYQVIWFCERLPKEWQTGVIIPTHNK